MGKEWFESGAERAREPRGNEGAGQGVGHLPIALSKAAVSSGMSAVCCPAIIYEQRGHSYTLHASQAVKRKSFVQGAPNLRINTGAEGEIRGQERL